MVKLKSMPAKVKMKKAKRRHGGTYCAAGGPSNYSCKNTNFVEGITMHKFPKDKELRKKWLKFVHTHRPNFDSSSLKRCHVCVQATSSRPVLNERLIWK